jgi:hypothetical protein
VILVFSPKAGNEFLHPLVEAKACWVSSNPKCTTGGAVSLKKSWRLQSISKPLSANQSKSQNPSDSLLVSGSPLMNWESLIRSSWIRQQNIMPLSKFDGLELPASADFHVHLRDGNLKNAVVPTIRQGGVNTVYVSTVQFSGNGSFLFVDPATRGSKERYWVPMWFFFYCPLKLSTF